ncbi:MAG TPA: hypothetical protein PK323_09485 [Bacteroidia bacterium]|nr:hypothetical protein [Bacteroidia bacterium]
MNQLPIESIKVTRVEVKGGFKAQQPEENSFLFLEQYFDKVNNKVKEIILSEEGDEEQTIIFEFNGENKVITEKHYFHFDEIEENTHFEYHEGLLVEKKKEYSYGSIETSKYAYNEYKLPISIVVLDEDGNEEESELFKYEGKNLVHYIKHNALIGKETEAWLKYDAHNRLIEEKKWTHHNLKTFTSFFDYSKNEEEPDIKVMNEKGAIIEAHIKTFNENKQLITHEIQHVDNGLKKLITTYEYNDLNKICFLETIDQKGEMQRRIMSTYNENGLLMSEDKSEYAIEIGNINTFTLLYEYTFHQK